MLQRLSSACLLRPEDVSPSDDFLEVVGTFNPGVVQVGNDVVLLVRVAERPRERREGHTPLPRYESGGELAIDWVCNDDIVSDDPRVVRSKATGLARLTFISHLLVVRSSADGAIAANAGPRLLPRTEYETFGIEDPRITRIGGRFYFTYVAVSSHGAATALASTSDFKSFERHGIVFPPENKDVVLFPERIDGDYVAFHRPNPATHFSAPEMWLARSADLIHWSRHEPFHWGAGAWETERIGGGAPPVKTPGGWLEIYHGTRKAPDEPGVGVYSAGALLLDLEDPQRVIARSHEPIITPEAEFEREGFVPDVVFPTGLVVRDEKAMIYYGAADAHVGVVEFAWESLLAALE